MKNTTLYQTLIEKGYKVFTATDNSRGIASFADGDEFVEFLEILNQKVIFAVPMYLDESNIVNDEMFDIEGVPSLKMKKIFSLEAKKHNEIVESFFTQPYKVHYFVASGYIYSHENNLLPDGFEIKPSAFVDKVMEEWEGTKEYEEMMLKLEELGDQQEAQHQARLKEAQDYLVGLEDIAFLTNQDSRRSWMEQNRKPIFKKIFPDLEDDFFGAYSVNKDGIAFVTTAFAKYKLIQKQEADRRKQEEREEREKQRQLEKEEKEKQKKLEKELKEQKKDKTSKNTK